MTMSLVKSGSRKDRVMPHDLEAERSVLGAVLLDENAIHTARSAVDADDFYMEAHRLIFAAMIELTLTGKPADLIILKSALQQKDVLEKVGGIAYLASLTEGLPRAVNVAHYANIIKSKAALRRMITLSHEVMTRAFSDEEEPETIISHAQKQLFQVITNRQAGEFYPVPELADKSFKAMEVRAENKQFITGIPTGFSDLDKLTRGFQPADYVIIAARPGMGKTTLALNIASHAALKQQKKVGIFSLEMTKERLMDRLISAEAEVDSYRIGSGHLTREDWAKISTAMGRLSLASIFINEQSGLTISEMFAKAHKLRLEHGLDLLIVDYLQLMRAGFRTENRTQEVTQISAAMKQLAKDLGIPVIVLCQLNRAIETHKGREPQLSDLRESGSIEQDADVVLFIHQEETQEESAAYQIFLKKQRNGPTGKFDVAFLKQFTKFAGIYQEAR